VHCRVCVQRMNQPMYTHIHVRSFSSKRARGEPAVPWLPARKGTRVHTVRRGGKERGHAAPPAPPHAPPRRPVRQVRHDQAARRQPSLRCRLDEPQVRLCDVSRVSCTVSCGPILPCSQMKARSCTVSHSQWFARVILPTIVFPGRDTWCQRPSTITLPPHANATSPLLHYLL
jgi:hypothetical protein